MLAGIDVSHWQGSIDWSAVAASGVEFAYLKATQAGAYVDANLSANYAGAKIAGLKVGLYHVFIATAGSANASHFVEVAKDHPADLPPWIDFEPGSVVEETEDQALDVTKGIAADLGVVTVYAGPGIIQAYLVDPAWLKYDLAIAHYVDALNPNYKPWSDWTFWQHSPYGSVPGIKGPCDLDLFNGDLASLNALIPTR